MIQIKKCIVILLVCFGQIEAHALIRYVKPGSAGTAPYLSWATASNDLQAVINASSSGDQIWVAAGTYKPNRRADATGTITANDRFNAFVLKSGVKIYGGFTGIELTLAARDFVNNVTFLSGDIGTAILTTDNCYHVVVSAGAVGTAELNGFTITRSNANGATDITVNGQTIISDYGGGMQLVSSSPAIKNCIFSNHLANYGGAMFSKGNVSLSISNCSFSNNSGTAGAAIYLSEVSTASILNSFFSNNSASGSGGAIFLILIDDIAFTNCDFTGNTSGGGGGGVYVNYSYPDFTNCNFSGNSAASGGAIYDNVSSSIAVIDCQFSGNVATSNGGGIYSLSPLTVNKCIFTANAASDGGGIFNLSTLTVSKSIFTANTATNFGGAIDNNTYPLTVSSCIFTANAATNSGGAIYNLSISSPAFTNCIFTGNSASHGGGIYNGNNSTPAITNCTIAANKATNGGGGIYVNSGTPAIRNSIIWGNKVGATVSSITGTATVTYSDIEGGYAGTGNINADPMFVNPQPASSAPTTAGDYRLLRCSPALDAGSNAAIPGGITTDLDDNPRIYNTTVDMGAYE